MELQKVEIAGASLSTSPEVELGCDPPKFVQPGMACRGVDLQIPCNKPIYCDITASLNPFQFYIVPHVLQNPHLKSIKKFRLEYHAMTDADAEEAKASQEFLTHEGINVAVLIKGRWHRAASKAIPEEPDMYTVSLLDTGELSDVHISKIRLLYFKYLNMWPALSVRCSFLSNPHSAFLRTGLYNRFFEFVTSANPNCLVIFENLFQFKNVRYWNVNVVIMRWRTIPLPEELVGVPGICEVAYNLLFQLRRAYDTKNAAGKLMEDYYHYF